LVNARRYVRKKVEARWRFTVIAGHSTGLNDGYTLNNLTAKKEGDWSVAVQFGGCDGETPNCLPIMPGWNYVVPLYRPRKEVLDGN
jgi:hypothetical protein